MAGCLVLERLLFQPIVVWCFQFFLRHLKLVCGLPFTIDVQTVIIYTLEGAKALFAILEDRRLLLSFKHAIYDPRDSLYPRSFPTLITKDSTSLTLYRTVHSTEPPGIQA